MQFKVNSELLIKNASDKSGVLVFVCFSSKALYFNISLLSVLNKINNSSLLDKETVESWIIDLSTEDKSKFWDSLINHCILVKSDKD
ncbi:MAG: hypothetical protein ACI9LE_000949 [Paraglaciecola sp.]